MPTGVRGLGAVVLLALVAGAVALPLRAQRRRDRVPVLPPVSSLASRGGGTPAERRIAALQLELEEARQREARLQEQLAQTRAALETISAEYLRLKQELQTRAEAGLSTRESLLLHLRRRLGAVEVALLQQRALGTPAGAEAVRALEAERAALLARIAAVEREPTAPATAAPPEPPPVAEPQAPDVAAALAAIRAAEAELRAAEAERDRVRGLVAQGLVPRVQLTRAERVVSEKAAALDEARAQIRRDRTRLLAAAEARVATAERELADVTRELERLQTLHAMGGISGQELAAQQARVEQARTALATARARLLALQAVDAP